MSTSKPQTDSVCPDVQNSLSFEDMDQRRRTIAESYSGTGEWIFSNPNYEQWRRSSRGILWIKGKPGSGKSVTMSRVLKAQHSAPSQIKLEFLFHRRGVRELQYTFDGMLRAFLWQLLEQHPESREVLCQHFQDRRRATSHGNITWAIEELKKLFTQTISSLDKSTEILIIVDALDEAGSDMAPTVVGYFDTVGKMADTEQCPLKILLSCRDYPSWSTERINCINVAACNAADIEVYTRTILKIDQHEATHPDYELLQEIKRLITKQADGVFLWVSLVTNLAIGKMRAGFLFSPRQVLEFLRQVPPDLKGIYQTILQQLLEEMHPKCSLMLFIFA